MKHQLIINQELIIEVKTTDEFWKEYEKTGISRRAMVIILNLLSNSVNNEVAFYKITDLLDSSTFKGQGNDKVCTADLENTMGYLLEGNYITLNNFAVLKLTQEGKKIIQIES